MCACGFASRFGQDLFSGSQAELRRSRLGGISSVRPLGGIPRTSVKRAKTDRRAVTEISGDAYRFGQVCPR